MFTIPKEAHERSGRTEIIHVRITPDELARIRAIAAETGFNPSEVMRAALWRALKETSRGN